MRLRQLLERPDNFRLKYDHPLAHGLIFAGLGLVHGNFYYYDSSLYQRHGTLLNMEATDWVWDTTLNRWRTDFGGTNECASIPFEAIPQPFSVAAWVYVDATGTSRYAVSLNNPASGNDQYYLGYRSGLGFGFWQRTDATFYGSYGADISGLHHVVGVANSPASRIAWVDGVEQAEETTSRVHTTISTLDIGRLGDSTPSYSIQNTADVCVWRRRLSASEIQQLANPFNVMLSGLIVPPKRKFYSGITLPGTTIKKRFFAIRGYKMSCRY